jgi:hypothetical protein
MEKMAEMGGRERHFSTGLVFRISIDRDIRRCDAGPIGESRGWFQVDKAKTSINFGGHHLASQASEK